MLSYIKSTSAINLFICSFFKSSIKYVQKHSVKNAKLWTRLHRNEHVQTVDNVLVTLPVIWSQNTFQMICIVNVLNKDVGTYLVIQMLVSSLTNPLTYCIVICLNFQLRCLLTSKCIETIYISLVPVCIECYKKFIIETYI